MSDREPQLDPLFRPRAVAVVGASREPRAIGHLVVKNLVEGGFTGPVYPINPQARSVRGLRAWPTIEDVPDDQLDLAVIVVPAAAVPDVLEACGRKGVRAAVIITAGFREAGGDGPEREAALRALAQRHGIRLVGPNCMGVISTDPEVSLNASFAASTPLTGPVAFASQSGALGEAILARAHELGLGLSAFVSLGNKVDVSGNDLLAHWAEDPRTRVILLYLESLGNPRRFAELAERIARAGKPILAVKSGRTAAGARATASHTGALAGLDEATTTLLEQHGVLRVTRVEGLFNLARAFASQPIPAGGRVAIVTNAGGPGIMAADAAIAYGLEMAEIGPQTRSALRALLPPSASFQNPIDTIATASPQAFGSSVAAVLADPGVDALLPIYVGPALTDVRAVAREILGAIERARGVGAGNKPVLACFMGGRADEAREVLAAADVPSYDFPEDAAQALAAMARYRRWQARPRGTVPPPPPGLQRAAALVADAPAGWLPAAQAFALLEAIGVSVAAPARVRTAEEAAAAARERGWPVVLKLDHPQLLHKSDRGAVRLGLADEDAVRAAARDMLDTIGRGLDPGPLGLLVQRQVGPGVEVLVGANSDPSVGRVLAFGLGGVHVEVLRDVALRVLPLTDRDADELLDAIRGAPLLRGHRGAPPVDRAALRDLLLRVAALVEGCPRLAELDLNPVLALPAGAIAVDVRARLE